MIISTRVALLEAYKNSLTYTHEISAYNIRLLQTFRHSPPFLFPINHSHFLLFFKKFYLVFSHSTFPQNHWTFEKLMVFEKTSFLHTFFTIFPKCLTVSLKYCKLQYLHATHVILRYFLWIALLLAKNCYSYY